ncbi:hypothetical protein IZY60_03125 [Lutibacter sp. B2]|nr:hypothetical protein [Lutibacter sp. B2]
MLKLMDINKRNKGIIMSYVMILAIILMSYLLMVALRMDGYNLEVYQKAYIYFTTFSLVLFSVMIPLWEMKDETYIKIIFDSIIFTISASPLILIIFMVGKINGANILLPLCIQILWGTVILSIKKMMNSTEIHKTWKSFLLVIFTFVVMILSSIFLFFYSQYAQLVITTIYDKDIPMIFFLNPVVSLAGMLHIQMGGANQMGSIPIVIYFVFWVCVAIISFSLSNKFAKTPRGVAYEEK